MVSPEEVFEFRASLTELGEGLDVIHESVERLREATGRPEGDQPLMRFETALAEIAGNSLTHGRADTKEPVRYVMRCDGGTVVAWVIDAGPSVGNHWVREMPPATSEHGRGLALARSLLDELGYERKAELNWWLLMKRL